MEQLANIEFCFKLGMSSSETHKKLQTVYGKEAFDLIDIHRWCNMFRQNTQYSEDFSECIKLQTTPKNIEQVDEIVRSNP